MKHQAIGVDIGTTGVKAALIDVDGRLLASATVEHDLHSPHTGWAEEDPADWIAGTIATLRQLGQHPELDRDGIAAIGVSGMVPAMVLLDASGSPVRPSIQQNDARAVAEVAELRNRIDQDRALPAYRRIYQSATHSAAASLGATARAGRLGPNENNPRLVRSCDHVALRRCHCRVQPRAELGNRIWSLRYSRAALAA